LSGFLLHGGFWTALFVFLAMICFLFIMCIFFCTQRYY
jgi:hypothetical protein